MGTITDKLTYLNTTKIKLRDSLNKFGSSILSTDTFRSYDTKLNDIYDKLPKVTATGQGLTISNVQNGLLDDFKMNGVDLEQNTTNGINKFYLDNNYSANYGEASIEVNNNNSFILRMNKTSSNKQSPCATIEFNSNYLKPNTTYTISKKNSNTGYSLNHVGSIRLYINGSYGDFVDTDEYTFTTPGQITSFKILLYLFFDNTTTGNYEITFYDIQLEENSTATDFEPYTGGIPSPNPDYPQEIKVVEGRQVITDKGKNLLDSSTIKKVTQNGITCTYDSNKQEITFNGNCTYDNTLFDFYNTNILAKKDITKIIVYYVSGSVENYATLRFFDNNYAYGAITDITPLNNSNTKIVTPADDRVNTSNYVNNSFRFNNGSVANNFKIKVMVTDDENTDYEPYYNPVSYNIDLHGKNVFNLEKYPFTPKVAYSSTGYQELNWTGYSGIKDYFPINGNTTYSFSNSTGLDIYYGLVFYDKNKTIISNITAHTTTFTTPSNCEYIRFSIHTEELPTWVQIEEGSTATNYEEYYDYKLAKMPNTDYKNKIYKNNGNWYFEKKVEKVVLDGSEAWDSASSITNTSRFYASSNILNSRDVDDNNVYIIADKFKGISWKDIYSDDTTTKNAISNYNNSSNTSGRIVIRIDNNYASTINEFKTWLSTHNVIVYYVLATPVTTQITNATLINQLEAISVHTGTNIITIFNDNNIIPEIEITRLKELEKLA